MSKLIRNGSFFFFLFLNIFFSNAQTNMFDTWRINNIIGIRDLNEYSMVRMGENRWGYMLVLNHDGTFLSRNIPECGNDTSRNALGHFILIDDYHIRFILMKTSYSSLNKEDNLEADSNIDLGIFFIYKERNSVRLIKSNGVLQDDKDKMLYTEMLNTFDENWKSYDYSWETTKANTPEDIVKNCIDNRKLIDLSNFKILFSKKESYGELFLVREKESFHYVLYDEFKQKVSLACPQ
jgi:hypothetical protein